MEAGSGRITPIVAEELNVRRQFSRERRQFGDLVGTRNQNETAAAVVELPGDLGAGERGMNWHMDGTGQLDCQIGDDPLVAVLADMGDALTRFDAEANERGHQPANVGCDVVPGEPVVLSVALDAEGGLGTVGGDAAGKQFDDGGGLKQHARVLCQFNETKKCEDRKIDAFRNTFADFRVFCGY